MLGYRGTDGLPFCPHGHRMVSRPLFDLKIYWTGTSTTIAGAAHKIFTNCLDQSEYVFTFKIEKRPSGWSKKTRKDLGYGIQKSEVVNSPTLSLGHLHFLSGALEHRLSKRSTNQNAKYSQAYTSGATLHCDWLKVWKALQSSQKTYNLAN